MKELARKKKQKREKEAESAAAAARREGASQIKSRSVGRPAARTPRSAFAAQRPRSSAMLLSLRGYEMHWAAPGRLRSPRSSFWTAGSREEERKGSSFLLLPSLLPLFAALR